MEQVDNSQPLFGDSDDKDKKQELTEDEPMEGKVESKTHWLFSSIQGNHGNNGVKFDKPAQKFDITALQKKFTQYLKEIKQQQINLPVTDTSTKIQEDKSVLATDNLKYLFKEDLFKSRRNTSDALFNIPKTTQQIKTVPGSFSNYFQQNLATSRNHLSRRAKTEKRYDDVLVFDAEDADIFDLKKKMNRNITKEASDLNYPSIKKNNESKEKASCINILSDDESDKELEAETISMDKDKDLKNNEGSGGLLRRGVLKISSMFSGIKTGESNNKSEPNGSSSKEMKEDKPHECPMCSQMFTENEINIHAFDCQGPVEPRVTRGANKSNKSSTSVNFSQWENACQGFDTTNNTLENYKIPMKNNVKSQGYSTKSNKDNTKPLETFTNKGEGKRKRTAGVTPLETEEEDIFQSYHKHVPKKPTTTYSRPSKHSGHIFNESQDDGLFKCAKCDNKFTEEKYNEHTNQCLEDSRINIS